MSNQITMHFGGGCLFLKCHNCDKDVGAEEVNFPGKPTQQIDARNKLAKKKEKHLLFCSTIN